ncbi:2-dehydro-3-deoxygalactonokinase [Alishewanella tabrizica]|uniref:2-oxo-3-deoxygalactonate kinase n=1 Tax=Alishewanella tabrizica TaxID=671278 RepID=A0ABQ2WPQ1_9ALTE|nr:2-dehydro-3-deoxygalactonokinase [Alishewanella tabrizica]GGW61252.1 2-oxo-3-deoxygalactonate kinase [Alishewanella tabrizica]
MHSALRFIALDWGSTRLRAYCCELTPQQELVLLAQASGPGVVKIVGTFSDVLQQVIAPFVKQYGELPIFMAGQISSSIGWFETPYLNCPVTPQAILHSVCERISGQQSLYIMSGLRYQNPSGDNDTMRGEELQLLGLLRRYPQYLHGQHLVCLPGTHCKWVLLDNGYVSWFKSAITGELFDVLLQHSILLPKPATLYTDDWATFTAGCQRALTFPNESIVHALFSVRTKQLFDAYTASNARSYLSGLLIGADVGSILHDTKVESLPTGSIILIGSGALQQAYATALTQANQQSVLITEQEVVLAGFAAVANQTLLPLSCQA